MGLLLPIDQPWNAANWVARGFFEDALLFVDAGTPLALKLQFCVMADLDTLDQSDATSTDLRILQTVIRKVIARNEQLNGSNFFDPKGFPSYMAKLVELRDLVDTLVP